VIQSGSDRLCSSNPERARERIIDIASTQFPDGGCYHQYQPLNKRGNNDIEAAHDDPLWLILGTVSYIRETGDLVFSMNGAFDNDISLPKLIRPPHRFVRST